MRSGKQNSSSTGGRGGKSEPRDKVDDLGDDMWNYMSFQKKDTVKDSIPDQQLSLQDLTVRFKGKFRTSIMNGSVVKALQRSPNKLLPPPVMNVTLCFCRH